MRWILAVSASAATLAAAAEDVPPGLAVPVTYSYNMDPSLSPDGKRMVFLKILEGHEQLFIAGIDGADERQLTRDPVDHEDPAWSPDGARIFFTNCWQTGYRRACEILRAPAPVATADTPRR
jgi:dipeptidyl aminopeptidase/acylaminoacyl peptidase